MKKYSKLMAVLLVVAMLLPGIAQAAPVADQAKVMRVAGDSRVGTSIKVSEVAMKTAKEAVLVGYEGEADALTGGILAKAKDAPLFFVRASEVEAVKARLDKLGVEKVHVLGGTTVFTEKLMNEFNDYAPKRITGDNRYQTAIAVAKAAVGSKADTVFLAKGNETLADALSIGAISAKTNTPLLLTHGKSLTDVTKQALKDMEVKNIEIIGGKSAVSEEIKNELEKLGYKVDRTAGDNRQATSVEIAKKFNPDAKEIVIANGFDYADAVTAGYFAAGRDAVVLLTNQNLVHPSVKEFLEDNKLDTTVLGGTSAIAKGTFDKIVEYLDGVVVEMPEEEEEVELKVESVSAINAKTIEVTFNKAVEDTSKATVELLRGTFKQNATVKWAEDAKSVQLVGAGNFQAGDYTVKVKGLTEEALTGEVKIEAVKVASIEILSEEAVLSENPNGFIAEDSPIKATVGYVVKDQYGTDITKTTTLTTNGNNVEAKEGTVTISKLDGKRIGDLVPVVLIHADSATTVSKTLKLSAAATVSEVEVEGVYDAKGKEVELKDNTKAADVFLVLNLKDQYNNEIKPTGLTQELTSVIVTNTNPLVTKVNDKITVKAIDGKNRFVVKFEAIDADNQFKGGSAELLFIKTMDGKTFKYTVNVAETQTTDAVTVGKPEFAIVGEDVLVPITVLDKEGNVITDKKLLAHSTKGIEVNAEDAKEANISVKDGQVYYNLGKAKTADKYETVTVQTSTFKIATVTYKVTAEAKPVAVRGFKSPLILTKAKTVEFKDVNVEDQYGRTMKELPAGYKVEVKAEENSVVKVTGNNKIEPKGPNGTATVTLYLYDTAKSEEVKNSAVEQQVRVTDGKEYDSYEIKEIGKTQVADVETAGNKEFTVNGILDGGKVALDSSEYVATLSGGVPTDSMEVAKVVDNKEIKIIKNNLKKDSNDKTIDTEFTLKVTINATGEVLEQKFMASKDIQKVEDYFFTITDTNDPKEAKELTKSVDVIGTFEIKEAGVKVVTTDQYNNKKVVSIAANTDVDGVTIVPADRTKVTIDKNSTQNAAATLVGNAEETELTVKVKIGNAEKDLKVNLKKAGKVEDVINATTGIYEGNLELTANGTEPIAYGPETGSRTIKGNVTITGNVNQPITLRSGLTITGDLIVNAPNATVENNATVNGTIIVNDVVVGTWNQNAAHNGTIEFNAEGKTLNIKGNVGTVNVNKKATVTVETGVKVQSLAVNKAAKNSTVAVKGTGNVGSLKLDAKGSTITVAPEAKVEDIKGEDSAALTAAKVEQATAAVLNAEAVETAANIEAAQNLVTALGDADVEGALQKRLTKITKQAKEDGEKLITNESLSLIIDTWNDQKISETVQIRFNNWSFKDNPDVITNFKVTAFIGGHELATNYLHDNPSTPQVNGVDSPFNFNQGEKDRQVANSDWLRGGMNRGETGFPTENKSGEHTQLIDKVVIEFDYKGVSITKELTNGQAD